VAAKAAQDSVRPAPVVRAISRRSRILRPPQGDLVPAEREADEWHAEPLERREPPVERSPAELEPRVVLDPVADARRSLNGACGDAGNKRGKHHEERQPGGGRPHRPLDLN
jgi:hypothetical protein